MRQTWACPAVCPAGAESPAAAPPQEASAGLAAVQELVEIGFRLRVFEFIPFELAQRFGDAARNLLQIAFLLFDSRLLTAHLGNSFTDDKGNVTRLASVMTSAPALALVTREANSSVPALGYTGTYAIASILLTVAGTLIMHL